MPEESTPNRERDGIERTGETGVLVASACLLPDPYAALGLDSTADRLVPAFKDGKWIGMKVFPNRILSRFGLRTADILRRVAGIPLDSGPNFSAAVEKLRGPADIRVEVIRGGRNLEVRIGIVETPSSCELFRAPLR